MLQPVSIWIQVRGKLRFLVVGGRLLHMHALLPPPRRGDDAECAGHEIYRLPLQHLWELRGEDSKGGAVREGG
jgi:hypothetical protein